MTGLIISQKGNFLSSFGDLLIPRGVAVTSARVSSTEEF